MKFSEANVQYEPIAQDIDHCSECEFYEGTAAAVGSCSRVAGEINPGGWCKLFCDTYNQI